MAVLPTASATIAATIAAAATGSFFARAGDVYSEVTSVQIRAIQGTESLLCFLVGAHGDKGEAAGTSAGAVHHEVGFEDGAVSGKRVLKIVFSGVEGKISYEQFIIHYVMFCLEWPLASQSVPDHRV